MPRHDRIFWIPLCTALLLASGMILVDGFLPAKVKAQASAEKAAAKITTQAKAEAGKVAAASQLAAAKLLTEAQVVATVLAVGPPAPASQPLVVLVPVKPDDPKGAAEVVRGAMHTSNWRLAVLAGLLLTVLLLRKVGGWFLPGRAAAWVGSDRGGATLALAAGVLTVLINGMIAGGKFDPQLLIDGVLAACTAAGGFNLTKRLAKPSDLQAQPAGPDAPKLAQ